MAARLVTRRVVGSIVAVLLCGLGPVALRSSSAQAAEGRSDFEHTGSLQTFVVPPTACALTIEATGASGGGDAGGHGAVVSARLPVTPGEQLVVLVGGAGQGGAHEESHTGGAGGFGGGGGGGASMGATDGGGGGGASVVARPTGPLVVAGGGGGEGGEGEAGGDAGRFGEDGGTGAGWGNPETGPFTTGGDGGTSGGVGGAAGGWGLQFYAENGSGGGVDWGGDAGGHGGRGDGVFGGGGGARPSPPAGPATNPGGDAGPGATGSGGHGSPLALPLGYRWGDGGAGMAGGGVGADGGLDGIGDASGGGGGGGLGFAGGGGSFAGGGGGGGYGGGGAGGGGGGGGSSFVHQASSSWESSLAASTGPGHVTITVDPATDVCPLPSAPIDVTAAAGHASARVSWRPPVSTGGPPVDTYTVVASPGGTTVTVGGSATTATVHGLAVGTTYTFTVSAATAVGSGPPSDPSNAVVPIASQCAGRESEVPGPFSDVGSTHVFCSEIEWLVDAGIVLGHTDGTFGPLGPLTRGAMATLLYRAAGRPDVVVPDPPTFSDVPPAHLFAREIEWAADAGIVDGYSDGSYRPDAVVRRHQLAAFLYRATGSPPFSPPTTPTFADVVVSHPSYLEIEWAADRGVVAGYPDGTFGPDMIASRQVTAAVLHRLDLLP